MQTQVKFHKHMNVVAMEAKKVIYCYSVLLLLAIVNGHGAWAIPGGEDIGLESQLSIVSNPTFSSLVFFLVNHAPKLLKKEKKNIKKSSYLIFDFIIKKIQKEVKGLFTNYFKI